MDGAFDIPDATDWLNTPLRDLARLENALHCQICKEFYDTPMITSCSHTFCSKCIRTSLSADGKCPMCRAPDQASKLRNNWALQEVVTTFSWARPSAIAVAREQASTETESTNQPTKRKRNDDKLQGQADGQTTRRKSRRIAESSQGPQSELVEVIDSDADDDFEPEPIDDGLVECPLGCGKRMKIASVEPHLDRCEDERNKASRARPRTPPSVLLGGRGAAHEMKTLDSPKRLSELNYSMIKENALTKKLRELGIPAGGSKQLMVRRHTAWVNLWNANCDSSQPRTKAELLRDLDVWERTQGGRAPNPTNSTHAIMRKDFDGAAWAHRNKDDFSRLIADARRKRTQPAAQPLTVDGGNEGATSAKDETTPDSNQAVPTAGATGFEIDTVDEPEPAATLHARDASTIAATQTHDQINDRQDICAESAGLVRVAGDETLNVQDRDVNGSVDIHKSSTQVLDAPRSAPV